MYSDKKNILQLVALLQAHGITQVVLCPGSRNAPIIHTLSSHSGFTCHSITDERSAGFFALGLSLNSRNPVAVCCTSGTALLNIHPAVAEAYYQGIPLVVISADRPAAWIGQMDGQTLPQPGVFNMLVKKSVNLPEIHTDEDEWYCNRLVNEALLATEHHGRGPVHINIPLSEALFQFTVDSLPMARVISRHIGFNENDEKGKVLIKRLNSYSKRMVVVGQMNQSRIYEKQDISAEGNYFVRIAEHIGNQKISEDAVDNFDAILYTTSEETHKQLAPELLITYGGHVISKRLKQFLRQHPPKEHWHVSVDGEIVDLYRSLTAVIEMEPLEFMEKIRGVLEVENQEYTCKWKELGKMLPEPDLSYSEMSAIGALIKVLPESCILHLANSSAVRYAQLYKVPSAIEVYCNRGTNGIEGSLSTAVGFAAASDKLNFVIIGDLSFFYDMNALWNNNYSSNLRILLLNNGGGEIFHTLPGLDTSVKSHSFISAPHQTSAKGWALECGFIYRQVKDDEQLTEAIELLTQIKGVEQPVLVEVFTDKDIDTGVLKEYYHQLKQS